MDSGELRWLALGMGPGLRRVSLRGRPKSLRLPSLLPGCHEVSSFASTVSPGPAVSSLELAHGELKTGPKPPLVLTSRGRGVRPGNGEVTKTHGLPQTCLCSFVFAYVYMHWGIKSKASHMLSRHSSPELHPNPFSPYLNAGFHTHINYIKCMGTVPGQWNSE